MNPESTNPDKKIGEKRDVVHGQDNQKSKIPQKRK